MALTDHPNLSLHVHFNPAQGKVWLDEQRGILQTLPAIITVWNEIVNTLGIERSRALFMLAGYKNGQGQGDSEYRVIGKSLTDRDNAEDYNIFSNSDSLIETLYDLQARVTNSYSREEKREQRIFSTIVGDTRCPVFVPKNQKSIKQFPYGMDIAISIACNVLFTKKYCRNKRAALCPCNQSVTRQVRGI